MKWFGLVLGLSAKRSLRAKHGLRARADGALVEFARRPALVFALLAAILAVAGCNDYGNTFQNPTGAGISFLAPTDASAGGSDFTLTVTSPTGGFVAKTVVQWTN